MTGHLSTSLTSSYQHDLRRSAERARLASGGLRRESLFRRAIGGFTPTREEALRLAARTKSRRPHGRTPAPARAARRAPAPVSFSAARRRAYASSARIPLLAEQVGGGRELAGAISRPASAHTPLRSLRPQVRPSEVVRDPAEIDQRAEVLRRELVQSRSISSSALVGLVRTGAGSARTPREREQALADPSPRGLARRHAPSTSPAARPTRAPAICARTVSHLHVEVVPRHRLEQALVALAAARRSCSTRRARMRSRPAAAAATRRSARSRGVPSAPARPRSARSASAMSPRTTSSSATLLCPRVNSRGMLRRSAISIPCSSSSKPLRLSASLRRPERDEHVRLDLLRAELPRGLETGGADGNRLVVLAAEHQQARVSAERRRLRARERRVARAARSRAWPRRERRRGRRSSRARSPRASPLRRRTRGRRAR